MISETANKHSLYKLSHSDWHHLATAAEWNPNIRAAEIPVAVSRSAKLRGVQARHEHQLLP